MIEWLRNLAADEFGRNLITIGGTLVAVVFGTFLGAFKDVFIESGKRKRLAWLTAVRLTVILDRYVDNCAENVRDTGEYDGRGELQTRVPQPNLEYPEDLAWTSLHRQLMYAAFRLKVEHDNVESRLAFTGSEIASPPDYDEYFAERALWFSHQGMAALELIRSLKDHYSVPTSDRRGWDPRDSFNEKIEAQRKLDEARAEYVERMSKVPFDPTKPPGLFPLS